MTLMLYVLIDDIFLLLNLSSSFALFLFYFFLTLLGVVLFDNDTIKLICVCS